MAMINCKECGKEISSKAKTCPGCGAKVPRKVGAVGWIMAGIVALFFYQCSSILNRSSNTAPAPTPQTTEAKEVAPQPEAQNSWEYSSDIDSVSNKPISLALLKSDNQLQFKFPYSGGTFATIQLRKHPRRGKDAAIFINKGQIICSIIDGCDIEARFDDRRPVHFHALGPDDNSTTSIFISPMAEFVKQLKKSKHAVIEMTFFQEGSRQFEFDTAGLNW